MELKELLSTIIRELVDDFPSVSIQEVSGGTTTVFEISAPKEDLGKIIGKSGRNADAIKTLMRAFAAKRKKKCHIEITQ